MPKREERLQALYTLSLSYKTSILLTATRKIVCLNSKQETITIKEQNEKNKKYA